MNDRELLELAAKAAGYKYSDLCFSGESGLVLLGDPMQTYWDPIADDGDALRLAVKLSIDMSFNFENAVFVYADEVMETLDRNGNDLCAATRRAIVRAAAEIGRQMQEGGAA